MKYFVPVIHIITSQYEMKIFVPINASACVHVVMETTNDGTDEQDRLTRLPSANKTILFRFGHIIWST